MQKLATLYSDLYLDYMANNDYKQVPLLSMMCRIICALYFM
jgi:hypothetical protein